MSLHVGVEDGHIVHHPAPVCSAVTALDFIQTCHLFQGQHVLKALLEVIRQEGVEDGVGAAVGVTEHHNKVEGALHGGGEGDGAGDVENVEKVEWQPAEDKDHDNNGDHACDLTLRVLTLGGAHSQTR